jgi:RNA polymerase sigma-70 factor (ECF subfamily)
MASDPYSAIEQSLIAKAQSGDEAAFTEILERYKRPVLDFVYRMIGDPDAAQDVAQEVFVRVWRGIGRFTHRQDAAFSSWLFQIARNACIDVIRRQARDPLHAVAAAPVVLEQSPSPNSTANDVAAREIGERVAAAVTSLPEDQRTVVALAEYEGLSYKEIAAVMNCSVKSVEAYLYRARQTLRHALRDMAPPSPATADDGADAGGHANRPMRPNSRLSSSTCSRSVT